MKLVGEKEYSFGNLINDVTEKQCYIINLIEEKLGKKFDGCTSKEAYEFIQKYHRYI